MRIYIVAITDIYLFVFEGDDSLQSAILRFIVYYMYTYVEKYIEECQPADAAFN